MTSKEWLMRGRGIEREIKALEQSQRETYERLTRATTSLDKISVRATKDPHLFDAYAALSDKIQARTAALIGVRVEIIQAVERLEDANQRTLLIERYVNGKTFEEIAADMHYTWRHVHRVHGAALIEMHKVLCEAAGGPVSGEKALQSETTPEG